MTCPNCKREAGILFQKEGGHRCHGCKEPSMTMPENLRYSALQYRHTADETRQKGTDADKAAAYALDQFAAGLEAEAAAVESGARN